MRPGEDVAVVGVGGVGINAVQGAKLAGANLRGANLTEADLSSVDFAGVNLTGATLSLTVFSNCRNLHQAKGLSEVNHPGPSMSVRSGPCRE